MLTWLVHIVGPLAPMAYLMTTGILGQIAIMMIVESAPVKAKLAVAAG